MLNSMDCQETEEVFAPTASRAAKTPVFGCVPGARSWARRFGASSLKSMSVPAGMLSRSTSQSGVRRSWKAASASTQRTKS